MTQSSHHYKSWYIQSLSLIAVFIGYRSSISPQCMYLFRNSYKIHYGVIRIRLIRLQLVHQSRKQVAHQGIQIIHPVYCSA